MELERIEERLIDIAHLLVGASHLAKLNLCTTALWASEVHPFSPLQSAYTVWWRITFSSYPKKIHKQKTTNMITQECLRCEERFRYDEDYEDLFMVEGTLCECTNDNINYYNKRLRKPNDPILTPLPKLIKQERPELEFEGIDRFFFDSPVHLCHRCFIELFLVEDYISIYEMGMNLGYDDSELKRIGKILAKWLPDMHFNLVEL